MKAILFVCTGNIFRSMIAEHALRAALADGDVFCAQSAGIRAELQPMREDVRRHLLSKGIDPSMHRQRRLSEAMLRDAGLAVAMGFDHQQFMGEEFGYRAPLFHEVCGGTPRPVLDIHEAVADHESDPVAASEYAKSVVDEIFRCMPAFVEGLGRMPALQSPS